MWKSRLVLVSSLVLNAVLVASFALPARRSPDIGEVLRAPGEAVSEPVPEYGANEASEPGGESYDGPGAAPKPRAKPGEWVDPVVQLVTALRRHGVDEVLVRGLAAAEMQRAFERRAREILNPPRMPEYWQPHYGPYGPRALNPGSLAEFQALRREKVAALTRLFGSEAAGLDGLTPANAFEYAEYRRHSYDYVPPDKRLELVEYLERLWVEQSTDATRRMAQAGVDPYRQELQQAEHIEQILGSELYEEYLKRSSQPAETLRWQLGPFGPTQAEFDALVVIEHEFREQLAALYRSGNPEKERAAETDRLAAIRRALGDARFEDFQRSSDRAFQHLDLIARERGLDPSAAKAIFAHVERARRQAAPLVQGRDLRGDAQASAQVAAIQKGLQRRLAAELGLDELTEDELASALAPATNLWPQPQTMRSFGRRYR